MVGEELEELENHSKGDLKEVGTRLSRMTMTKIMMMMMRLMMMMMMMMMMRLMMKVSEAILWCNAAWPQ